MCFHCCCIFDIETFGGHHAFNLFYNNGWLNPDSITNIPFELRASIHITQGIKRVSREVFREVGKTFTFVPNILLTSMNGTATVHDIRIPTNKPHVPEPSRMIFCYLLMSVSAGIGIWMSCDLHSNTRVTTISEAEIYRLLALHKSRGTPPLLDLKLLGFVDLN